MGLVTIIAVETDILTQATKVIAVTRRCSRRGIPLVQSTTLAIIMTTATNMRSVINLITTMVSVINLVKVKVTNVSRLPACH